MEFADSLSYATFLRQYAIPGRCTIAVCHRYACLILSVASFLLPVGNRSGSGGVAFVDSLCFAGKPFILRGEGQAWPAVTSLSLSYSYLRPFQLFLTHHQKNHRHRCLSLLLYRS